jgi:hypothetical protein
VREKSVKGTNEEEKGDSLKIRNMDLGATGPHHSGRTGREGGRIGKNSMNIGIDIHRSTNVTQERVRAPITEVFNNVIGDTRACQLSGRPRTKRMRTHTGRVQGKQRSKILHLSVEGRVRQQRETRRREEKGKFGTKMCDTCIGPQVRRHIKATLRGRKGLTRKVVAVTDTGGIVLTLPNND